jgi:hypothetical protein
MAEIYREAKRKEIVGQLERAGRRGSGCALRGPFTPLPPPPYIKQKTCKDAGYDTDTRSLQLHYSVQL